MNDISNAHIVVFDGVCNLCHAGVNFALKYDKNERIKFTSAQSDIGQILQEKAGVDILKEETVLFFEQGKIFLRGKAATRLCKHLAWPVRLLYVFHFIPAPILNSIYKFIARNRYQWFGKKDTCMVPDPSLEHRFLYNVERKD